MNQTADVMKNLVTRICKLNLITKCLNFECQKKTYKL